MYCFIASFQILIWRHFDALTQSGLDWFLLVSVVNHLTKCRITYIVFVQTLNHA